MGCPIDYDWNNCSSKEYNLMCKTCNHGDTIEKYLNSYLKLAMMDNVLYGYIKDKTQEKMNEIIDRIFVNFTDEEIKKYISKIFNVKIN
jgi:hypothetical protein